jgi:hypothetical protein
MWDVAVVVLQWASVAILAGAVVSFWISYPHSGYGEQSPRRPGRRAT